MTDQHHTNPPFEGPEKLLEIWFAPSPAHVPGADAAPDGKHGLRKVSRQVWDEVLAIVKCQVLSVTYGEEIDAYLLSESSLFVSPHRLILKTCGTTVNLLGLPRILEVAREHADLPSVYRLFYSRKAFMFPERQHGPHRDWRDEVNFLDDIFSNGAGYTVGKVNGDHWLLYITSPGDDSPNASLANSMTEAADSTVVRDSENPDETFTVPDYTIEILMTHLAAEAREPFFTPDTPDLSPSENALSLSSSIGISELFPAHLTTLDAYSFTPCGYSSNALIKWGSQAGEGAESDEGGEGYYTIHVTPEEGWSYASFECNVPLPTTPTNKAGSIPDLKTLIRRVVNIFRPGRLTLTLFISSEDNSTAEEEDGLSAIEAAQRAFKAALTNPAAVQNGVNGADGVALKPGVYKRTDKINYEFGGYDLAFATFELRS
ncbi:S-adenosylmethionine decarboxylase [Gloeophyllum trabeum ATCC 11539]|uniref:adenosylmethionine decarboxylase n=1 Tax=Gloeophyllum trabeum (strain ATCC 11539 / FP-39264 / Madison 617) TaxID=670483 RepID=S7QBU2_GLOTA|nr:S-adenosylmethionine decarboxylase [Gloeophyllum trabeum ATCC 11539]EPQ57426.1 S-adenosylmethionine decarboxylase [Gloeophyllum trabeum ATCC 11539]